jgi:Flp pilus assembly protein TadG
MRSKPAPNPHVRCPRGDRGSVSIWIATCAMVMIILVGLAVDLGGQVYAQQHARDVAGQAARAGGQQLQVPAAVRGDAARVDPARAAAAARAYLAASDVTGSVTVGGGGTVVVHTTATYQTKFLGIIGIDSLAATGTGTARIARVVEGVGR